MAHRHGMDFVELRSLGGTIDLPEYCRTKDIVRGRATLPYPVRLVSSSLRLAEATDRDIEKFMEFAKLAEELHAPYVRVFGGGQWPSEVSQGAFESAARVVGRCRELLKDIGLQVEMLLETHDAFSSSERCLAFNRLLDKPIGILWDSHHTWRLAGESPLETWKLLSPWVCHIHYKDSIKKRGSSMGYEYVLPGRGEFPTEALAPLLRREKREIGVSLEWEKLWHPELAPLETALEYFKRVISA